MDHDSIELWKKKFTETFLETYFLFVNGRKNYFIFPFFFSLTCERSDSLSYACYRFTNRLACVH
jgi:hypothetical protein